MSDIYIVGVAMTPFGRYLDRPIKDMTRSVVNDALADAGAEVADIEAAWFANAAQAILEGQGSIPGEIALRNMGIQEIPVTNVENACASASTALFPPGIGLTSKSTMTPGAPSTTRSIITGRTAAFDNPIPKAKFRRQLPAKAPTLPAFATVAW